MIAELLRLAESKRNDARVATQRALVEWREELSRARQVLVEAKCSTSVVVEALADIVSLEEEIHAASYFELLQAASDIAARRSAAIDDILSSLGAEVLSRTRAVGVLQKEQSRCVDVRQRAESELDRGTKGKSERFKELSTGSPDGLFMATGPIGLLVGVGTFVYMSGNQGSARLFAAVVGFLAVQVVMFGLVLGPPAIINAARRAAWNRRVDDAETAYKKGMEAIGHKSELELAPIASQCAAAQAAVEQAADAVRRIKQLRRP